MKYYCGQYKECCGSARGTFTHFTKNQVNELKKKNYYQLIVCPMDGKIVTVNEEYLIKHQIKWWEFWK